MALNLHPVFNFGPTVIKFDTPDLAPPKGCHCWYGGKCLDSYCNGIWKKHSCYHLSDCLTFGNSFTCSINWLMTKYLQAMTFLNTASLSQPMRLYTISTLHLFYFCFIVVAHCGCSHFDRETSF